MGRHPGAAWIVILDALRPGSSKFNESAMRTLPSTGFRMRGIQNDEEISRKVTKSAESVNGLKSFASLASLRLGEKSIHPE